MLQSQFESGTSVGWIGSILTGKNWDGGGFCCGVFLHF